MRLPSDLRATTVSTTTCAKRGKKPPDPRRVKMRTLVVDCADASFQKIANNELGVQRSHTFLHRSRPFAPFHGKGVKLVEYGPGRGGQQRLGTDQILKKAVISGYRWHRRTGNHGSIRLGWIGSAFLLGAHHEGCRRQTQIDYKEDFRRIQYLIIARFTPQPQRQSCARLPLRPNKRRTPCRAW